MTSRLTDAQHLGRIGGLIRAARGTNEAGRKEAAQKARMARLDALIPEEITDPVERARRRDLLLRAEMAALGRKSAIARRNAAPTRKPPAEQGAA